MVGDARPLARAAALDAGSQPATLHAGAWLAWIAAVGILAFLTSNPLYLALAFFAALGVYVSDMDSPRGRAMLPVVIFGLLLAVVTIPLNLITGSNGESVLFELPSVTFPRGFGGVTLGGEITGESLVSAGGRAVGIATLVVAAAAFNSSIDHFRLLKLAPPAFAQVMIVFTIAVLVVPQGIARAKAVAEGRRLRGHSNRGVRSIASLIMPVLQGALEGAVQRAESLDARGFGGRTQAPAAWKSLLAVVMLGVFAWGSFSYYYYGADALYIAAMCVSALGLVATLYAGPRHHTSGLRRQGLTTLDITLITASVLSIALVCALRLAGEGDVTYLPYPDLEVPSFHPAGAIAAVLLFTPAVIRGIRN